MIKLGQPVIYRSKTGDYSLSAIVTATTASINLKGVEAGYVPPLTDEDHVHLVVFTPGLPPLETPAHTSKVIDRTQPLGTREFPAAISMPPSMTAPAVPHPGELGDGRFLALTAFGGTYAEFDIPRWRSSFAQFGSPSASGEGLGHYWEYEDQAPGTWTPA